MDFSGDGEMALIRRAYEGRRTALLTGPAAIRVMGFATLGRVEVVDLVLRGNARPAASGGSHVRYRSGRVDPLHWRSYKGFDVVSLVMALFDTFRYHGYLPALVSVESALQHPDVTKESLLREARALPRARGKRGFVEMIEGASESSESVMETLGRHQLVDAALPGVVSIEQQVSFHYVDFNGRPRKGRADMVINGRVFIEFDGRIKERDDHVAAVRHERERERWLLDGSRVLIRVRWEELQSGEFLRKVERAIQLLGDTP